MVLVHPEIHWNTGNVGRTCLAVAAHLHLVAPLGFSLADAAVRRAGLDYWPRVPLTVWENWDTFEAALPELGEPWLFSAEATRSFWEVSYTRPAVLVFGRESDGLPQTVREQWREHLLRVPMVDQSVRSLNLSTTVALAAYEVRRQLHRVGPALSLGAGPG